MYYTVGSKPVTDVARTRPVYLPAGTAWYDFWTGQRFDGGQTIAADATLDTMPLYVRAGSIVPMGPPRQYVDDRPDAPIEIHVYAGSDTQFLLYEDEGDSYNYEQGAFSTILMRWEDETNHLTLEKRSGQYPGMPAQQAFLLVLHGDGATPDRAVTRQIFYSGEPVEVGV
jgi:alpha-D-xyloside xylohydrolase